MLVVGAFLLEGGDVLLVGVLVLEGVLVGVLTGVDGAAPSAPDSSDSVIRQITSTSGVWLSGVASSNVFLVLFFLGGV